MTRNAHILRSWCSKMDGSSEKIWLPITVLIKAIVKYITIAVVITFDNNYLSILA